MQTRDSVLRALVFGLPLVALIAFRWRKAKSTNQGTRDNERIEDVPQHEEAALMQRERFSMLRLETEKVANRSKLRCALLCGPFGSGKTTILRYLLREIKEHADFQCAAVINDFADIGVDAERVIEDETTGVAMAVSDGCICCTLSKEAAHDDALAQAITALNKRADIDCAIVEANGMSEVSNSRVRLSSISVLESVIGVLDVSTNPPSGLSESEIRTYAVTCDVIVLNKCDIALEQNIKRVEEKLISLGSKRIIRATKGGLNLNNVFQVTVHKPEGGPTGLTVSERKAATRYSLSPFNNLDISMNKANQNHTHNEEGHRIESRWDMVMLKDPVESLSVLQDVVYRWWKRGTLKRAKGRIWIDPFTQLTLEFQYSGRCRLQLTPLPNVGPKTTRIVAVSDYVEDLEILRDGLKGSFPSDIQVRMNELRTMLAGNPCLSVLPSEPSLLRFRITCKKKFGFDEVELQEKFGVLVSDVNLDFATRVNCNGTALLVAFDGDDCYISLGTFLDPVEAAQILESSLLECVKVKFAVVSKYCRCE